MSRVHTRVQNSKAPTLLDPLLNSCIRSSVQSLSTLDKRGLTRPTSRVCCSRPLRGVLLSHLSLTLVAMEMMALRRSPLLLFAIIIVAIAFRKQSPLPEDWKVMPTPPPSSGFALSERLRSHFIHCDTLVLEVLFYLRAMYTGGVGVTYRTRSSATHSIGSMQEDGVSGWARHRKPYPVNFYNSLLLPPYVWSNTLNLPKKKMNICKGGLSRVGAFEYSSRNTRVSTLLKVWVAWVRRSILYSHFE